LPFKVIIFDAQKCNGCGICVSVCPANKQIENKTGWGSVQILGDILLSVRNGNISIKKLCHHCNDPQCVKSCKENNIAQDPKSKVIYIKDPKICENCKDKPCIDACPFDSFILTRDNKTPIKCTQCYPDFPKCVQFCPSRLEK